MANFTSAHEGQWNMAEYLRDWTQGNLCFHPGMGWYHWTGKLWELDENSAVRAGKQALLARRADIERQAKAAADFAFANPPATVTPKAAAEAAAKEELKQLKHVRLCETGSGFSSMLRFASTLLAVDEMDANPGLLNMPNGTFDMDRGVLRDHKREDYITKITSGSYITEREFGDLFMDQENIFRKFLADILPDPEDRMFVQVLFGISLYGDIKERILPVFHGAGFNGKSTLLNAMLSSAGTYGITLASNTLLSSRGSSHSTELTDLKGRRMALFSETDSGQELNASLIKRLTSPGDITARRMRQDDMTWRQSHSCFMDTNFLPRVNGGDKAMFDRLRVLEFTRDISDHRDPEMDEKLDSAEDAILTWGLEGYMIYKINGRLQLPPNVKRATMRYQDETDNVKAWLEAETEPDSGGRELRTPLYMAYSFWSESLNEKPLSNAEFYRYLESAGYTLSSANGKRYVKGLRLTGGAIDTMSALFAEDIPEQR
jgi:putative DNA primase/helicase